MSVVDTLGRITSELGTAGDRITKAAADALADSVMRNVRRATRSGRVAGESIDVRAVPRTGDVTEVRPVSGTGALAIVSNGSRAHAIGSDGQRLRIGSGWATGPVRHPGTRGTDAFDNGIREGMAAARAAAERTFGSVTNGR